MEVDIKKVQDIFQISYDAYEKSRQEERRVTDYYHNRQFSTDVLAHLKRTGQPAETFNVIKTYGRLLVGYYSTIASSVTIQPVQEDDGAVAQLLHELVQHIFEQNNFKTEGDKVKLDALLSGLMCVHLDVIESGEIDPYNRPIYEIKMAHVPSREILLDPMSTKEDYSDARWITRYKWVSKEFLTGFIKQEQPNASVKEILLELKAYSNHTNKPDAEFERFFNTRFVGINKTYDTYLLVHTVLTDEEDKTWSIYWCCDKILSKKEITYKEVKFPYRVHKLNSSNKAEYYGLFRELMETQDALNQALLKLQTLVNTKKVFLENGAVEDLDVFHEQMNSITAYVEMKKLSKMHIDTNTAEIQDQYRIIEEAKRRVKEILGITDSFLGSAYSEDSGRKLKLQQDATTMALRYATAQIEEMYRLMGIDIINLAKQYYTAYQSLRITTKYNGNKWIRINEPVVIIKGVNPDGTEIEEVPLDEVIDPASGEPITDDKGRIILAPIPTKKTEIAFAKYDVTIKAEASGEDNDKNRLLLENLRDGAVGQFLMSVDPEAYCKLVSKAIENVSTKNSAEMSAILLETAQKIATQREMAAQQSQEQPQEQEQ